MKIRPGQPYPLGATWDRKTDRARGGGAVRAAGAPARVVVENVRPRVDDGRHPVKRTLGDTLVVSADVFVDGPDTLAVVLRHRVAATSEWHETPMQPLGNDLWRVELALERLGDCEYAVVAWPLRGREAVRDDREGAVESPVLRVRVDRERACFGAWYEMFPRSAGGDPTRSATLREAAARLPDIAAMGFDVLYLPPIHPIGGR